MWMKRFFSSFEPMIVEKPVDTVTHVDEAIFQSFETMVSPINEKATNVLETADDKKVVSAPHRMGDLADFGMGMNVPPPVMSS
ncbi:uncharacterized protein [Phaseolus vulgaris]|uniref:uncharacterized protein isoform X2 n=1 Tax=Phaseolus vulgaris TaxID=3885 RepID=UPI0035CA4EDD